MDRLTDTGRQKPVTLALTRSHSAFKRLVPGMARQAKAAGMTAQKRICIQYFGCTGCLFRRHVNVGPFLVVLPGIKRDKVEPTEALGNLCEVRAETGIAAKVQAPRCSLERVAGP